MVRVPFPGASWNKRVSELGWAEEQFQPLAERFRLFAGGPTPPGYLALSIHDYSVPIYDANIVKPNMYVRLFQSSWAQNGSGVFTGIKIGETIPWNMGWLPGTGNDRIMIIENLLYKGVVVTLELWDVYDSWWNGFNWANILAGYFAPGEKVVTAGVTLSRGIYDSGWKTISNRGMGINKRALITTADEVMSGDIGHCLEVTVTNTAWTDTYPGVRDKDFFVPATRCEWLTRDVPTRNGPTAYVDLNPAHNLPEGLRIAVEMSDEQIDEFIEKRNLTVGKLACTVFVKALRDYGMIIAETGGYGNTIETTGDIGPDRSKWAALGITAETNVFGDLLNQYPLKIVKAG